MLRHLLRNTRPRITDTDDSLASVAKQGHADTANRRTLDRIQRITQQIDEHLLSADGIADHRYCFANVDVKAHVVPAKITIEQHCRGMDRLGEIDRRDGLVALARKTFQLSDDDAHTCTSG